MRKYLKGLIWAGAFLGLFICGNAFADIISFDLSVGNADISGFPAPYANVAIDQTGNEADITVTAYDGYMIGGNNAFGINPNGYTGYSVLTSGFSASAIPGNPEYRPRRISEFGLYSLVFKQPNFSSPVSELRFTLTGSGWDSAADVLTLNSDGYLTAAHIRINDGSSRTGYAATPIPAALWLLGFGVGGLVGVKRRIR